MVEYVHGTTIQILTLQPALWLRILYSRGRLSSSNLLTLLELINNLENIVLQGPKPTRKVKFFFN